MFFYDCAYLCLYFTNVTNHFCFHLQKIKLEKSNCKHETYICKERLLTVTNVTYADAGNYNCTLDAHKFVSVVKAVWVQVIGK